jgi:hypothetical protein
MDTILLVAVGIVSLVVARRLVLRAWLRGRIGRDGAALLWAAGLPLALVGWSSARQQLDPVLLLIALILGGVQFLTMRYLLREVRGDHPI